MLVSEIPQNYYYSVEKKANYNFNGTPKESTINDNVKDTFCKRPTQPDMDILKTGNLTSFRGILAKRSEKPDTDNTEEINKIRQEIQGMLNANQYINKIFSNNSKVIMKALSENDLERIKLEKGLLEYLLQFKDSYHIWGDARSVILTTKELSTEELNMRVSYIKELSKSNKFSPDEIVQIFLNLNSDPKVVKIQKELLEEAPEKGKYSREDALKLALSMCCNDLKSAQLKLKSTKEWAIGEKLSKDDIIEMARSIKSKKDFQNKDRLIRIIYPHDKLSGKNITDIISNLGASDSVVRTQCSILNEELYDERLRLTGDEIAEDVIRKNNPFS